MSKTRAKLGKFHVSMVPFPRTTADFHSEAKYRSSMEQAAAGDLGNVEVTKAGRHAGPLSTHSTRFFQSDSPFISSFPAALILSSTTLVQRLVRPTARFLAFQIGASAQHGDIVPAGSAGSFETAPQWIAPHCKAWRLPIFGPASPPLGRGCHTLGRSCCDDCEGAGGSKTRWWYVRSSRAQE